MPDEPCAPSPAIDVVREAIEASRSGLLVALDGITQPEFEHEVDGVCVRDLLWAHGQREDWYRRSIDQAAGGRPVDGFALHPRPERLATPDYLIAWIDQTRRPLLALLRRLSDADLEVSVRPPDGAERTPRAILTGLAADEHALADAVRVARSAARGV
ncbi:MAG: hypothetical protein AMXMBFR23_06510 [Chloroflexota bacterium]